MEPVLLTCNEAAALLNVSETTIRRCLRDGQLGGYKVRGAVRITRRTINDMLSSRRYRELARTDRRVSRARRTTYGNGQNYGSAL